MISTVILTDKKKKLTLPWCGETLILEKPNLTDFAAARNEGLRRAKGEWVLFVDDDEVVTPELQKAVRDATRMTSINGYYLRRQDYFMGRFLKFGETTNVRLLRLGQKGKGFWKRAVHEVWEIADPVGEISEPLYHYSHPCIKQFIENINHHTEIEKKLVRFHFWDLSKPAVKFWQNYISRLGFLDGFPGFVMAYMMSLQSLITRIKQYDFSQNF